jgi:hypothetical protein
VKSLSFILVAGVATLLCACSRPTETVIPSDMSKWDKELAQSLQKLDAADRELAGKYLMRTKMSEAFAGKSMPVGTTLGQAIESEKKFEAEQAAKRAEEEALKKKLLAEQAAALATLDKAATVTLVSKREVPKDFSANRYSEYQELVIGVKNNSDKPMAGIAGEMKFIDLFDKEVASTNFRISESIPPGGTYTWHGGRNYNQFIESHRALWNLELGKFTTKFVPDMIVYADGTKLTMPK